MIQVIETGMTLGPYELEHKLGEGGMGQVWMAYHAPMDRHVALKILTPGLANDSEFVSRFRQEVKLAGKLHHPHIIPAYEAGIDHGMHYLSMAFIDGIEVEERIESKGRLPAKEALRIAYHIANALDYVWNQFKILHRDIKPSNIMVDAGGKAYLMDMGISKSLNEDVHITLAGMIVGTPNYMSPEQATGKNDLDCRSDIYALGATLYHMMTGKVLFDDDSTMNVLQRVVAEKPPPPRELNPDIPPDCAELLEKMLEKNPADRHQNWGHVKKDICRVSKGKPIRRDKKKAITTALPADVSQKQPLPTIVLALIALLLILIALVISTLLYLIQRDHAQLPATLTTRAAGVRSITAH